MFLLSHGDQVADLHFFVSCIINFADILLAPAAVDPWQITERSAEAVPEVIRPLHVEVVRSGPVFLSCHVSIVITSPTCGNICPIRTALTCVTDHRQTERCFQNASLWHPAVIRSNHHIWSEHLYSVITDPVLIVVTE